MCVEVLFPLDLEACPSTEYGSPLGRSEASSRGTFRGRPGLLRGLGVLLGVGR